MLFSDIRQPHSVWLLMIFECRNVKNNRYFVLIFLYFNVMLKLCLSICMKIVLHITVIMKALHKCINHYNWMDKNSYKKIIFVECLWHISCRSEKIRMNDLGATVPHVLKIYGAQKMHKFWTDKYGTPGNT